MKIYLYSKTEEKRQDHEAVQQKILRFFKDNGVNTLTNLQPGNDDLSGLSFDDLEGLVVEGKESAAEVGYLIAMALSNEKPILYLLPKGSPMPDQLRVLLENKKLKKLLMLDFYNEAGLEKLLMNFLDLIETGELRREVPSIKFTLRFTPRADRYLSWKSSRLKQSKADILRNLIDEEIKKDEQYQNKLQKSGVKKEDDPTG